MRSSRIEAQDHRLGAAKAELTRQRLALRVDLREGVGAQSAAEALVEDVERHRLAAAATDPPEVAGGDPPYPRLERALAAKGSEVREDNDKDLLRRVLGVGGVAEHTERQPVHVVLERVEDGARGLAVAGGGGLRLLGERLFGRVVGHGFLEAPDPSFVTGATFFGRASSELDDAPEKFECIGEDALLVRVELLPDGPREPVLPRRPPLEENLLAPVGDRNGAAPSVGRVDRAYHEALFLERGERAAHRLRPHELGASERRGRRRALLLEALQDRLLGHAHVASGGLGAQTTHEHADDLAELVGHGLGPLRRVSGHRRSLQVGR